MATNKERIESLEVGLGALQDNFSRMKLGVTDKLHQLEATISKVAEALFSKQEPSSSNANHNGNSTGCSHIIGEDSQEGSAGRRPMFSSQLEKLKFPKYSGEDPTEWFTRVDQFFYYQCIMDTQKVPLATFHLEGEANQWWQWLRWA